MKHTVPIGIFAYVRRDAADNRYAIVTATRQLLIDEGPDVSMRTIAKAAKVGVATVTRHFPERIELLNAVSEQTVSEIADVIADRSVEFTVDTRRAWRETVHEIGRLQLAVFVGARQGVVDTHDAKLREIYGSLLAPVKHAGLCPANLDPSELHFALSTLSASAAPERERLTRTLIDTLLDGLEAQAHSAEY